MGRRSAASPARAPPDFPRDASRVSDPQDNSGEELPQSAGAPAVVQDLAVGGVEGREPQPWTDIREGSVGSG